MTSTSIDIVTINNEIESVKKISLKDAIATMSTAKFYTAKNTDARAKALLSVVASLYNFATTFETFDDDDVDAAIKRACLLNAKETFCIAQRVTNHLIHDEVDAAKVVKLREASDAIAKKLAKYEAKQAKLDAKQEAKQAKLVAKQEAKQAKQAKVEYKQNRTMRAKENDATAKRFRDSLAKEERAKYDALTEEAQVSYYYDAIAMKDAKIASTD